MSSAACRRAARQRSPDHAFPEFVSWTPIYTTPGAATRIPGHSSAARVCRLLLSGLQLEVGLTATLESRYEIHAIHHGRRLSRRR
jgi:hypothetical protein